VEIPALTAGNTYRDHMGDGGTVGEQPDHTDAVADGAASRRLEAAILAASATGDIIDVRSWSEPDRHVAAEFLRALYLGREPVDIDPRGPALIGLIVDGDLDLRYATVDFPLHLVNCQLDGQLRLDHARTRSLRLDHVSTPRISAEALQLTGLLSMTGVTLSAPGGAALDLDGAEVTDSVLLHGLNATGQVRAVGARVGGSWSMAGANLASTADFALGLDSAEISGAVFLNQHFNATGEVRAVGADIRGQWNMDGATLTAPDGDALSLDYARITGTVSLGDGFHASGAVRARGARIEGGFNMIGAVLTKRQGDALILDGVQVTGNVCLDKVNATGQLSAVGIHVTGRWSMANATLSDPAGPRRRALDLENAEIAGDVLLDGGFHAKGEVHAVGARVGGRWSMVGATLTTTTGIGLHLDRAEIRGDVVLISLTATPPLSMRGTKVTGALADDPGCWPADSQLDGFEYALPAGALPDQWSAAVRAAWLGRMVFSTQAYRHLADRYRARGMPDAADTVMIAMRRSQRRLLTDPDLGWWRQVRRSLGRAGDWLIDRATGYGYRPTRVLVAAAAVLAATVLALSIGPVQNRLVAAGRDERVWNANSALAAGPALAPSGQPPVEGCTDNPATACFQPVLYALDTIVPLVDLDQRSTWRVDGNTSGAGLLQFALDAARLVGWLVAAAVTFVIARHFQTRHG
jgi:hypothetical protein